MKLELTRHARSLRRNYAFVHTISSGQTRSLDKGCIKHDFTRAAMALLTNKNRWMDVLGMG